MNGAPRHVFQRVLSFMALAFLLSTAGGFLDETRAQPGGGDSPIFEIDLGVFGIRSLSALAPPLVFRPVDDHLPRPGGDALALGGAYIARAEGLPAIGWDPAGLVGLETPALQVDGFSVSGSGTASGYPPEFEIPGAGSITSTAYEVRPKSSLRSGFIAAGMPLWERGSLKLAGALSWRRFLNTAFPEETVNDFIFGDAGGFPVVITLDRKERGGVEAVAPTFALGVGGAVSVGANLNFLTGRLRSNLSQDVAAGGPLPPGLQRLTVKYSGFVPDFGARASLANGRLVGALRFTPAYTLQVRGGDYYSRSLTAPGQPVFILHGKLAGYDLDIPSSYGVGIAIHPHERLWLSADRNSLPWTEAKATYSGLQPSLGNADPAFFPFQDVESFHVGLEFVAFRPRSAEIPLRIGYRQAPQSFADLDSTDVSVADGDALYASDKQVEGDAISFGGSLRVSNVSFDLGVERLTYDLTKLYLDSPIGSFSNPDGQLVDVKRSLTTLRFSTTYRFRGSTL